MLVVPSEFNTLRVTLTAASSSVRLYSGNCSLEEETENTEDTEEEEAWMDVWVDVWVDEWVNEWIDE